MLIMKKKIRYSIIKIITASVFIIITISGEAQNVGINTDNPDNSALLELSSTNRGFLLPRMTTVQRDNIDLTGNPLSILIFNTDSMCFQTYVGNQWNNLWCYDDTTSKSCPATVKDADGNTYNTVLIGTQCWFKENLKTRKYNDTTDIVYETDDTDWGAVIEPKYCWYENDSVTYADDYGALYNWHAVATGKLCPEGWHVPSDEEWKLLEGTVDSLYPVGDPEWDGTNRRGYDAGKKLKATYCWDFLNPSYVGTDDYGFEAVGSGYRRSSDGDFLWGNNCSQAYWWTSDESGSSGRIRRVHAYYDDMYRQTWPKESGYSVRCLKD